MTDPIERLARQLARIEKAQRDKGSTSQLGSSAIIDGGAIREFDIDNTLKQVIGQQPDGTNTTIQVNGPIPPTPSAPSVEPLSEAVRVVWDGTWLAGEVAPLDLARIDVHLIPDELTNPLSVPSSTTIASAGWGEGSFPVTPGNYFVALVAWTTSGKSSISPLSEAFTVSPIEIPSDGLPPSSSPSVRVWGGIGSLIIRWPIIENPTPVTYQVHIAVDDPDGDAFTPTAGTLQDTIAGNLLVIEGRLEDTTPLSISSTYYVRVIAQDDDGAADPGLGAHATIRRVGTTDIAPGAVTSSEIADFAIPVKKLLTTTHVIY